MIIQEKYSVEREKNKNRSLVLVGTGVTCFELDWNKADCDYWACGPAFGEACNDIKKIDLGFEIHPIDQILLISKERNIDFNKFKCPIFVQNAEHPITKQMIEKPITFPIDDMLQYVKEINAPVYFTSSFCYMIVYAAMMGYKDVLLYRILLTSDLEYNLERPGMEYWIDRLGHVENINFEFPEDAEMFSGHILYGYEQRPNLWKLESRRKYLWSCFMQNYYQAEELNFLMNKCYGLLEMYSVIKQNIEQEKIDKIIKESQDFIKNNSRKLKEAKEKYFQFAGSLQTMSFEEIRQY